MENPHYETGSQDLVTIGAGEFMVSAYYCPTQGSAAARQPPVSLSGKLTFHILKIS